MARMIPESFRSRTDLRTIRWATSENQPLSEKSRYKDWIANNWAIALTASAVAALFGIIEVTDAALSMRDRVLGYFDSTTQHYALPHIQPGNSTGHVEEIMGTPQVTRLVEPGMRINYYHTPNYLLTVFSQQGRVEAYTLIAMQPDFEPEVALPGGPPRPLGKFTFSQASDTTKSFSVDYSRSINVYLEAIETGPANGFVEVYLGSLSMGVGGAASDIRKLYDAELLGNEEVVTNVRHALRRNSRPNFYGEGTLPIDEIEESVMTHAEFANYFDSN